MEKNVNPWTGKTKSSKNVGLFNSILFKHYPELERPPLPNPYLEMIPVIESEQNSREIEEYRQVFSLKGKIEKMEQILEWIERVEDQVSQKTMEEQIPINSSFVYIPVYGYNTFHEILKQCVGLSKEQLIRQQSVSALKMQLRQIEGLLQLNDVLMSNIL